jgi:hypothetical protein
MTFTVSEQSLLDTLKSLAPQTVYADAAKKDILRGFKLFVDRRTTGIAWEGEGMLVLHMGFLPFDGPSFRPASVRIFMEGGFLRHQCSQPGHDARGKCEHVICALITVIHVLRPNLFRMVKEDPAYQARLEAGLFKRDVVPLPPGGKVVSFRSFQAKRSAVPGRPFVGEQPASRSSSSGASWGCGRSWNRAG